MYVHVVEIPKQVNPSAERYHPSLQEHTYDPG